MTEMTSVATDLLDCLCDPCIEDDMLNPQPELNESGYGYDELKDFDEYKDNNKSKITPFLGPNR